MVLEKTMRGQIHSSHSANPNLPHRMTRGKAGKESAGGDRVDGEIIVGRDLDGFGDWVFLWLRIGTAIGEIRATLTTDL